MISFLPPTIILSPLLFILSLTPRTEPLTLHPEPIILSLYEGLSPLTIILSLSKD